MNGLLNGIDNTRIESMLAGSSGMASKATDTISTGTGIVAYDLEPKLKTLYPALFPFVTRCPRKTSKNGGLSTNWKTITGINTSNISLGVSEGNRSANISIQTGNALAMYKTLGLEADLTFEADEVAESFDDARAIRTDSLLNANRIGEEKVVLFGNGDSTMGIALGTPAAAVVIASAVAGTVVAATYQAFVVALTYEGLVSSTIGSGIPTQVVRTNVDGSSDTINAGSSNVSAASNSYVLGAPGSVGIQITPVKGAMGYAIYLGTTKATAALAAIISYAPNGANSYVISAPPAGTQVATAITADNSVNSLLFTGLIPSALSGGCYFKSLGGGTLTSDGASGINEWDAALAYQWDNYRLGANHMLLNAHDHLFASKLILANGGAPLVRFNSDANGGMKPVSINNRVTEYYNKITGEVITLETHPYMPKGMQVGYSDRIPYTAANVPVPFTVQCRSKDWYEIEWPLITRRWQHGQYVSELFKNYFPPSQFVIADANVNA